MYNKIPWMNPIGIWKVHHEYNKYLASKDNKRYQGIKDILDPYFTHQVVDSTGSHKYEKLLTQIMEMNTYNQHYPLVEIDQVRDFSIWPSFSASLSYYGTMMNMISTNSDYSDDVKDLLSKLITSVTIIRKSFSLINNTSYAIGNDETGKYTISPFRLFGAIEKLITYKGTDLKILQTKLFQYYNTIITMSSITDSMIYDYTQAKFAISYNQDMVVDHGVSLISNDQYDLKLNDLIDDYTRDPVGVTRHGDMVHVLFDDNYTSHTTTSVPSKVSHQNSSPRITMRKLSNEISNKDKYYAAFYMMTDQLRHSEDISVSDDQFTLINRQFIWFLIDFIISIEKDIELYESTELSANGMTNLNLIDEFEGFRSSEANKARSLEQLIEDNNKTLSKGMHVDGIQ